VCHPCATHVPPTPPKTESLYLIQNLYQIQTSGFQTPKWHRVAQYHCAT